MGKENPVQRIGEKSLDSTRVIAPLAMRGAPPFQRVIVFACYGAIYLGIIVVVIPPYESDKQLIGLALVVPALLLVAIMVIRQYRVLSRLDIYQGLKAEIEQAKRILELEDDWDGEGSPGYSEDTFNRAVAFLTTYAEGLWESCGIPLPVPRIGPGPDGSIDLHWKLLSRELLVNIPADANEVPTFYGDNYGALKNRGTLDPKKFNLEIAPWLMN